jgi:hypothetical protein
MHEVLTRAGKVPPYLSFFIHLIKKLGAKCMPEKAGCPNAELKGVTNGMNGGGRTERWSHASSER